VQRLGTYFHNKIKFYNRRRFLIFLADLQTKSGWLRGACIGIATQSYFLFCKNEIMKFLEGT
jgi:hypothetical protein